MWRFLKTLDRLYGFSFDHEICGRLMNSDITQCTTHSHSLLPKKKRSAGAFCNLVFSSQFSQATSLTPSS